ncbi:MAG TPA: hypothetical protein VEV84_15935 [Pyrinomonadaceae bacterium]|nr:hypothetical protein [Pyrinomonadaceae bacterium]
MPKINASNVKQLLNNGIRPVMRLSEADRLIRRHRIIVPPFSRRTLIKMCEEGTFETVGNTPTRAGWLIYEDSFVRWVESLVAGQNENAAR